MSSVFKAIKEFEGIYEISNNGKVLSIRRNIIKRNTISKRGYHMITLNKNGKTYSRYIHRLVAEAFLNNTNNKEQVNHIDGCKANNHIDNLEWCTDRENREHAVRSGLIDYKRSAKESAKVTSKPVLRICLHTRLVLSEYPSINEAARIYNTDSSTLTKVCKGKMKKCAGYVWEYKVKNG